MFPSEMTVIVAVIVLLPTLFSAAQVNYLRHRAIELDVLDPEVLARVGHGHPGVGADDPVVVPPGDFWVGRAPRHAGQLHDGSLVNYPTARLASDDGTLRGVTGVYLNPSSATSLA